MRHFCKCGMEKGRPSHLLSFIDFVYPVGVQGPPPRAGPSMVERGGKFRHETDSMSPHGVQGDEVGLTPSAGLWSPKSGRWMLSWGVQGRWTLSWGM